MNQSELKKYLGYCRVNARRYSHQYPDLFSYEDLYSAAEEGLALAISKYSADKGCFPKYVWEYIKGYVQVAIRKRLQDESRSYTSTNDDQETVNMVELAAVDATQESDADYRSMMLDIKRQIEKLPRAERDYAILTLVEGCNGVEVAERMGVSDQRVAQLKRVVVEKLRKWNKAA